MTQQRIALPSLDILSNAWHFPGQHEDPDRDFEHRLESVADAIREANGDWSGYWSQCRLKHAEKKGNDDGRKTN